LRRQQAQAGNALTPAHAGWQDCYEGEIPSNLAAADRLARRHGCRVKEGRPALSCGQVCECTRESSSRFMPCRFDSALVAHQGRLYALREQLAAQLRCGAREIETYTLARGLARQSQDHIRSGRIRERHRTEIQDQSAMLVR